MQTRPSFAIDRLLVILASLVVIIAGIKQAGEIIVPFLMAVLLAIIASPSLQGLRSLGMPTWLAMTTIILAFVSIGIILASVVGSSVSGFNASLPLYEARLTDLATKTITWMNGFGLELSSEKLLSFVNAGNVSKLVTGTFNAFGNVLTNFFFIALTAIFMLLETSSLPGKLRSISHNPDSTLYHLDVITRSVKQYFGIKTLMSLGTGIMITVWLWIVGVDFPVLWGLLAFLLNYVPNIGSILAAVPAILLALIQLSPIHAVWTAGGFVAANVIIGNVIEPRFMGQGLGLSTLVVFVSLVFWGWVLGTVGMFLSVPLTMAVKVALESEPQTRWIGVLLGPGTAGDESLAVSEPTDRVV